MHHFYSIPGVTDLGVQRREAEKVKDRGGVAWIHHHKRNEECTDICELLEPEKEA